MRTLSRISLAFAAILTFAACDDPTAPEENFPPPVTVPIPDIPSIKLAPFQRESVDLWRGQGQDVNEMLIYAPVGVDPIIDQSVSNSSVVMVIAKSRTGQKPEWCADPCPVTSWRITVFVRPISLGQATVTVWLVSNPSERSGFVVYTH